MRRGRESRRRNIEAELARTVLRPIRQFWRDHDEQHLKDASVAVEGLFVDDPKSQPPLDTEPARLALRIRGWLAPQRRFHLSVRALRRTNPGYQISVRRTRRKDVITPKYLKAWRSGFELYAEGSVALPRFTFGASDVKGQLWPLPPTNADAVYSSGFLQNGDLDDEGSTPYQPVGAVDEIFTCRILDPGDRTSWVRMLSCAYPLEMLELVEYQRGSALAVYLAESLTESPINARWAARFAMSAGIEFDVGSTGFCSLRVLRPPEPTLPGPLMMPLLKRTGSAVTANAGTRAIPMPSNQWLKLEDARVQSGGIVTVGSDLILYEEAADPSHDFVAGYEGVVFGSRAIPSHALLTSFPPAEETIAEGILLAGRNDNNWYHWLIEYLPRVLEIPGEIGQDVPLLVSTRTPQTGLQALRSLSNRRVVFIDPGLSQAVSRLHVLAPPVQILDSTRVPWASGLLTNPAPLNEVRRVWRKDAPAATRLIFLRRSSGHREMDNEPELERIARSMGLEILEPGSLTWDQQREIFTTAKLVVGASGAVMADYLLMPQRSRVLALTSELLGNFALPAVIASIGEVEFSYLLGPTIHRLDEFTHRRDWFHSDFTIDADVFKAVLHSELQRVS